MVLCNPGLEREKLRQGIRETGTGGLDEEAIFKLRPGREEFSLVMGTCFRQREEQMQKPCIGLACCELILASACEDDSRCLRARKKGMQGCPDDPCATLVPSVCMGEQPDRWPSSLCVLPALWAGGAQSLQSSFLDPALPPSPLPLALLAAPPTPLRRSSHAPALPLQLRALFPAQLLPSSPSPPVSYPLTPGLAPVQPGSPGPGKHLLILFQKIENSSWVCSTSSSPRTTCAASSKPSGTSRSVPSCAARMATARVRGGGAGERAGEGSGPAGPTASPGPPPAGPDLEPGEDAWKGRGAPA